MSERGNAKKTPPRQPVRATESPKSPVPPQLRSGAGQSTLPDHPVRLALLDLLAEVGTVTSTQAAGRLGYSSGLCSFHLRQLARHGFIEEAPHEGGRARPWQLRWESEAGPTDDGGSPTEFNTLARGLEDESYQQWLAHRDRAPAAWQKDESFSAVLHLTPAELTEVAASIRTVLAGYRDREQDPTARPADTVAVAAITRLFPLLND
ncbi:winged helix-turn-helix domain-containing protein [Streptomyces sp. NPDC004111]|uniref:winged helix-turn-helix domain-containing protein n=1 Tax=Streptomyces sp. NPDC004111 TaxID=3364690 RepID=UPI003681A303